MNEWNNWRLFLACWWYLTATQSSSKGQDSGWHLDDDYWLNQCVIVYSSGSSNGSVLVYNLTSGLVHKELSVHSCEVRWGTPFFCGGDDVNITVAYKIQCIFFLIDLKKKTFLRHLVFEWASGKKPWPLMCRYIRCWVFYPGAPKCSDFSLTSVWRC